MHLQGVSQHAHAGIVAMTPVLRRNTRLPRSNGDPCGSIPRMGENSDHHAVAELFELRAAEAMVLNQRHLNPKLGRVVQTLGFDRDWAKGRGPYLIDREGTEY